MTTKEQYLKECVLALKPLEDKRWYLGVLAVLLPSDRVPTEPYLLFRRPNGLFFFRPSEGGMVEDTIVDAKPGETLYAPTDRIVIDGTWLPHVTGKVETTVGRLFVNAVAIYPALGNRIPYQNEQLKVKALETAIAALAVSDNEVTEPDVQITMSQYVDCMDRLWFFTKLASVVNVAATPRTMLPPPGIDELRAKLLKENEGKMSDPVVVATISDTLDKYGADYLRVDPAAKVILDRKGHTARRKLYHMYGETNDFEAGLGSDPITSTMQQGVDTSDAILPKYMNDLRFASYSRGHSTQLSGYSYKILQRSLSGIEIVQQPCNTQQGVHITVTHPDKLVNRYVRVGTTWQLTASADDAGTYFGKSIVARSPMYCTTTGNAVCYACMGENFKGSKNAINNIAAGFSGELMTLFLKRMHTSGFSLTDIQPSDLFA